MFDKMAAVVETPLRWKLADDDGGQPRLFPDDEIVDRHRGIGEYGGLEFLHVNAGRIVNRVPPSSRMDFRYTINAYRGCSHACKYCFARPTHEYLGLGTGEDFETKLVVKVNAVERARAELSAPSWRGDLIAMGTNTDPYQHAEGKYHLTRGIVEVLSELRNPFSILTKSTLILRDLDVIARASKRTDVRCNLSIGTLKEKVWRATEPHTPHPGRRIDAVRRLTAAGVKTGVLVAPIIPGWSDDARDLEELTRACLEAGAVSVTPVALHLRPGVREHFLAFVAKEQPHELARFERLYLRSYLPATTSAKLTSPVLRVVSEHAPGTGVLADDEPTPVRRLGSTGDETRELIGGPARRARTGPDPYASFEQQRLNT